MSFFLSNQYQVRVNPNAGIIRYQIVDENDKAIEAKVAFDLLKPSKVYLQEGLIRYVHLGNIIYSPTDRPDGLSCGTYNLKKLGKLSPDQSEYQNLLSRFFKQVIRQQREMVSVGNKAQKLFQPGKAIKHDDKNLQIWPGIECILTHHKATNLSGLTIDCAFKVLRYKTAFQEMVELRQKNQMDRIVGEIVMTSYNKKFYKIERINSQLTSRSTFLNELKEEISFADYYKSRYNIEIKNIDAPLLEASIREKNRTSKETLQRTIQLVPELCQMTGLTEELRNNFHAMKAIATTTKPRADTRIAEAAQFVKQLNSQVKLKDGTMRESVFTEWGIQINPEPMKFPEKSLPPGSLLMQGGRPIDIRTANLDRETQQPVFKNGLMARWAVFYCQRDEGPCQGFLQEIDRSNHEFKFGLTNPVIKIIQDGRNESQWFQAVESVIQMANGPQNVHFFLFILPGPKKKAPMYTPLKQMCIQKYPLPTQVILFDTIKSGKGLRSICNKLVVQIVSKTGGVPWAISDIPPLFSRQPTMVVGYDIFHRKSDSKPSQLAFCSTIDPQFARYHSQNLPSGEFSTSLKPLCEKAIEQFKKVNNGIAPLNIVVFRDGASDGQEEVVRSIEIAQFQQAIEAQGKPIKLVFVLTNKRVSTKFYTQNFDNPQPGSVIDSIITSGNDFFLISQKTTQGTVTPTHYKVLHNDFSEDKNSFKEIQLLAFKLCFLYFNWTGSIKVPGPVRYAHTFSNFIGDRYSVHDPNQFLPHENLVNRNTLFYI